MAAKPLTPQQLYDSLTAVLGTQDETRAARRRARKAGAGATTRAAFVDFFRPAEGADPTEYATGIPQVLRLMNAPQMNRGGTQVADLVKPGRTPAENIERLYLATLSRRPSAAESQRLVAYLQEANPIKTQEPREAYADVLWVLLNSSEFALNH
jgi:hypothetical protein